MFVLHGKQAVGGFAPFSGQIGASFGRRGGDFLPLPPLQSVSVSLPSGIQPIFQLGIQPLRDIVNLSINPTEVAFTFPLAQDYPYYPQLVSLMMRDSYTRHYPIADFRIYLGETFLEGASVALDLSGCLIRRITFTFRDGIAQLSLSWTVAAGVLYLTPNGRDLCPTPFAMSSFPARRVATYCRVIIPPNMPADFLSSSSAYAVTGANIDANFNTRLQTTFPTLTHALWGTGSPLLPTAIPATVIEGTENFTGELTLALPPAVPMPPIASLPAVYEVILTTDLGLEVRLHEAKVGGITPAISAGGATTFTIGLQGKGISFMFPA